MKIFFDLFPVGLFFLAYQWGGIYWATGSAIAASTLQIITLLLLRRHVDATAWIGFVVIALFGGLTLWTHLHPVAGVDATLFIRWKPEKRVQQERDQRIFSWKLSESLIKLYNNHLVVNIAVMRIHEGITDLI